MVLISADPLVPNEILTATQLSFLHGCPEYSISGPYQKFLNFEISEMNLDKQQRILGNGMHLHAELSWFVYACSHLVRRDFFCKSSSLP